jgi:hypothetical protein
MLARFSVLFPANFPDADFSVLIRSGDHLDTSGLPTRTKPLARRTLPRRSTERV